MPTTCWAKCSRLLRGPTYLHASSFLSWWTTLAGQWWKRERRESAVWSSGMSKSVRIISLRARDERRTYYFLYLAPFKNEQLKTLEVANFSRPQESYRLKRPYTGGWKPGGWTVNPVSLHSERVSALKVLKVDDLIWLLYERLYRLDIVIMMILFSSAWRNGIISPENSFQAGERTVCICVIIWPRWNGRTVKLPFGQLVTSRWIGNSLTKSMMHNSSEVYTY